MKSYIKPVPAWDGYYPKKIWDYLDESIKYLRIMFDGSSISIDPCSEENETCALKCVGGTRSKFDNALDGFVTKHRYLFSDVKKILKRDHPDCQEFGIILSRFPLEGVHTNEASTLAIFGNEFEDGEAVHASKGEDGFMYMWFLGQKVLYHEMIWMGHYQKNIEGTIIHIDGDKTNNKVENLKEVFN